jgi:HAD superfamily hydrolase (TIGR01544 family)
MVEEVIIVNDRIENIKGRISNECNSNFHVVSDFDRTLTYGLSGEGKRTATVISQLRSDPKYLGQNYFDESHRLHSIYYPIEINPNISLNKKVMEMHDWWTKHFELMSKSGLTKDLINRVVKERPLQFRDGSLEFMSYLNEYNIPLIIMSAAPGDMLIAYLESNGLMFPNIYVVSNRYEFDSNGVAIKVKEPIIHTFNKTEIVLNNHPIFEKIRNRKNVLLLGDSLGDVGMVEGFDYDNLIKIGFYNEEMEDNLDEYKKAFDVVLTGDQDFDYINKLIEDIFK